LQGNFLAIPDLSLPSG